MQVEYVEEGTIRMVRVLKDWSICCKALHRGSEQAVESE